MSRGGRGGGGAGGFRGGGFRGGGKSGGANVPWTYDPEIKPDYKPSELFPVGNLFFFFWRIAVPKNCFLLTLRIDGPAC
jgi:hypothetical protein